MTWAKQFPGVSYDRLMVALRLWQTVGSSPFTASLATEILGNGKKPQHLAGMFAQFRNAGVVEDISGRKRSLWASHGGSTKWQFSPTFQEWARVQEVA